MKFVLCEAHFSQEYTTMQEPTTATVSLTSSSSSDVMSEILRQGAQRMLATAIESEVSDWIEKHSHIVDDKGHRQVVRNGYLPERTIVTGWEMSRSSSLESTIVAPKGRRSPSIVV